MATAISFRKIIYSAIDPDLKVQATYQYMLYTATRNSNSNQIYRILRKFHEKLFYCPKLILMIKEVPQ